MNGWAYLVVALVELQRLAELLLARRNTRALMARGGVEIGAGHYPLIVGLHAAWLLSILYFLPHPAVIRLPLLMVYALLQAARIWVLASLGPYWTTRIIALPGAPLVKSGPYRYFRHPNYLVVAAEILVLPLVFGETMVALVFTLANGALLYWRIRQEETGLVLRR